MNRPVELLSSDERRAAQAIAALCYQNPFEPERIELEKRALGAAHRGAAQVWSLDRSGRSPNVERLGERCRVLVERLREGLRGGARASEADLTLYQDLVRYHLFFRLEDLLLALAQASAAGGLTRRRVSSYRLFKQEASRLLDVGQRLPLAGQLPHLFATLFQLRRAFHLIFERVLGTSRPAAALRASIWESIFTHDMRRYQRSLYRSMHEVPTLITGASGTGKELVARAIGMSRYIPFDAEGLRFAGESATAFHALHIAALAPSLLESELFGHKKGAFTDAIEDRVGWLEQCPAQGSVFLDEVGELDGSIQVKLLRVLQTRQLSRVGETELRSFDGKLIAATHRDLAQEMRAGRFREDFYYRLCADRVHTPSLSEQLCECPEDLSLFVRNALTGVVDAEELESATAEVSAWIAGELGAGYDWPGNMRELEQCVRSVLVRGDYRPAAAPRAAGGFDGVLEGMVAGELTADAVLDAYCTLVYHQAGSYQEAARRLELDRRTVKARIDRTLLAQLRG